MHVSIQHNINITLFTGLKPTIKTFTNHGCNTKPAVHARELQLNFNSKFKMKT